MSFPALTPSRPAPPAPGRSNSSNYATASSSASAYSTSYTGIGGSPDRGGGVSGPMSAIVRQGYANVKEDGFASFLWNRRWLVLKDQILSFHKNEVSSQIESRPTRLTQESGRLPLNPPS